MNQCSILAFFSISMRFDVKLSAILRFYPFRLILLEKTFFLTLYLLSFTMNGIGLFWTAFFFLILCVRSRSAGEISMFAFVDIVYITKSSVTSSSFSTILWTKRPFPQEYYLCFSISFSRFSTFLSLLINSLFFVLFLFFLSHTRQILWI